MPTSPLTWLAISLATLSTVSALPAEEKRPVEKAAVDGKTGTTQNIYSGAASSFATQTANAQSITSALSLGTHTASPGAQMVTATIDGAVVSWVNDYPNHRSTNAAGDVEVTATINGQVVSWANNWTPNAQSTSTPSTSVSTGVSQSTIPTLSTSSNSASATAFPPPTTAGGLSSHGTLEQGYFPKYLPGNTTTVGDSPSNGSPWDHRLTSLDAYTHSNVPNTGVTRYYNFTLARGTAIADGVARDVMIVNGQFPGPTIEANWGDYIEVEVHNQLGDEGSSIHWHGLRQSQTPWMDGVPSLSQCPIAPGASFTYRFQAEVYGSSWYHAHYSAQNNGGLLGPMVVYGPSSADYDLDVGPVLLTDWYRKDYYTLVAEYVGTDLSILPFTADSNLISGRGRYPCSTPSLNGTACNSNPAQSAYRFTPGKTHRLRLVNAGTEAVQKFSIDNHTFTVIAQDWVSVVPFQAEVITLGVGQRTDVIVTAHMAPGSAVWMRSTVSGGIGCTINQNPAALAAIFYDGADTTIAPSSEPNASYNQTAIQACHNDPLQLNFVPSSPLTPGPNPTLEEVQVSLVENATGHFAWELNNQSFHANYNHPIANQASKGNLSFPAEWQVHNYGTNSSIRINLYNPVNATHPWHVHGRDMYVLSEGEGEWDGTTIVNPTNPVRRDTHIIRAFGHLVLQFDGKNPGVWPFHCHIAWHLSGGLYMNLLIDPDAITPFPSIVDDTCTAWDAWSNRNVVDEIDSGL